MNEGQPPEPGMLLATLVLPGGDRTDYWIVPEIQTVNLPVSGLHGLFPLALHRFDYPDGHIEFHAATALH